MHPRCEWTPHAVCWLLAHVYKKMRSRRHRQAMQVQSWWHRSARENGQHGCAVHVGRVAVALTVAAPSARPC